MAIGRSWAISSCLPTARVIYNRGGNRDFGSLRDGPAAGTIGRIARWGYVVVASQYRGGPGSEGQEEFGGAEVNGVMNLIPLPVLLLHGTADWRVDPTDSLRMATALLQTKHPFRLIMFEGGDHGLSEYRSERDQQVKDWLDRYVRDRKEWPSLDPHGR